MSIEQEASIEGSITNSDLAIFASDSASARYLARQDFLDGFIKWRIWLMLAYQDIKLRYRRSLLGPFWITLSMAITVYTMGFLYSQILNVGMERYYPFLVAGMLAWSLISSLIIDYTDCLVFSDVFIKEIKLPYHLYIHRIAARNLIIFLHNILVIVPVLVIFHSVSKVNTYTLLIIPGLMIIYLNALIFGLILAMIGARYRDVSQIIKSLMQVAFFITPVIWLPDLLKNKTYFIDYNPFYAYVDLIRSPLLGTTPSLTSCYVIAIVSLIGMVLSSILFTRFRARIVYWL